MDDWQHEKRDFLQSLNRLSTLPRRDSSLSSAGQLHLHPPAFSSPVTAPRMSAGRSASDAMLVPNKTIIDKKASASADVVRSLNDARGSGLPFKPASPFKAAYDSLGIGVHQGKSVSMQKIWHLVESMVKEDMNRPSISRKMQLVVGARRHLEWVHEKYVMDTIQSHPTQAALGGSVGNLQKIRAFLRVRLRDYGVLDFDATEVRRQPPVDTTWQQIYFCLRTGYYDEARYVAQSSRVAHSFIQLLADWVTSNGALSPETALAASDECDRILRLGDRAGRPSYDRKKLLLYAMVAGCRRQVERLLKDIPSLFNTIEDFMWFKLAAVRESPSGLSPVVSRDGFIPYSLEDLQSYLNKFEPSYYTKSGKDPLVYPYVLLLSVQLLPAMVYFSKDAGEEGYDVDAVHISIVFADHGVLPEGTGTSLDTGIMNACAEVARIIRQYGSVFLRSGNLQLALAYFAQAAAAMGGGEPSWTGQGTTDQIRQRSLMLRQLLTEILLRDGGISFLLGPRGMGEEGELRKFMMDRQSRQQFLLEAAQRCLDSTCYDKSVEIHNRVGAFSTALETINKCLSDAICAMVHGTLDSESRASALVHSGNDVLESFKYSADANLQEKELMSEKQTVLRQLEMMLFIHKLAKAGKHVDALREIAKLSFLPLDSRPPHVTADVYRNLSPYVQACGPDLLKVALDCLDSVRDTDGSLRSMRSKIANFIANNMTRSWPQDLYMRIAQRM